MSTPGNQARAIFLEAIEQQALERRAEFVAVACGEDLELRAHVERLIRSHEQLGSFHDAPPADVTLEQPFQERPGTLIGPYKLLQQIGEGGMGAVFMAEQSHPVQRKVALKLIKAGMDSGQVIARFEAERQALALMDHPNIAKVLDAGATAEGRPYFVMELVKGVPITTYCDENHLAPKARLELFTQVCQAVQHAHQKGIIHRDLKPSNVLVALYDDKPVPKVIDFGVAKATGSRLTEKTMFTGYGQIVGTLEYMSPEQARLNALDIDTRGDIYSLGVLLYELLTGTTPFDKKRLREAAFDEMMRMIREDEPPKPSTRLSTAEGRASIAANRGMEPNKLSGLVRGELDWIVMKALEKDRNRRYETANGFAADVLRYLNDEPVQACPPSASYRFRKFARRNKGALSAVAVLGMALLVAVSAVTGSVGWAARDRAARQSTVEQEVNLALKEAALLQEQEKWPAALSAAKRAAGFSAGADSDELRERTHRLRKDVEMVLRLDEIRLLSSDTKDDAFDWESADRAYAKAFVDYGIDVTGLPLEEAAARIRAPAGITVALVTAVDDWGFVRFQKDKAGGLALWAVAQAADPDPWRRHVREAVRQKEGKTLAALAVSPEIMRQPPTSSMALARALDSRNGLGAEIEVLRRAQSQYPGDFWINYSLALALDKMGPPYHDEAISFGRAALAVRPQSSATHSYLGNVLRVQGKLDEAITCYKKAIELDPRFGPAHNNLGIALGDQHKLDEAIDCFRKAIKLSPTYTAAHNNLGNALRVQGRLNEAVASCRKAIELDAKFAGAHHNLGTALAGQGKVDEAMVCFRQAIKLNPKDALAHSSLGNTLNSQGKLDEAIACHRKATELAPKDAVVHSNLGIVLNSQGKLDEAIACHRKAIELDPKSALSYGDLGNALGDQGKLDEAITCFRKAIEFDPKKALTHSNLGKILGQQGNLNDAITSYRKAIELDPKFALAHSNLGAALAGQGKADEAIAAFKKAIELDPKEAKAHYNLGIVLFDQMKPDAAIVCYKKAIELDPKYALAHNNLALAFSNAGKTSEAIAAYRRIVELWPNGAEPHNSLAWLLATVPEAKLRDSAQAVTLAKKAVEIAPKEGDYWNTLGVAHYRAEDWKAAGGALEKSMQLRKGGDSHDWLFLAMANWQLGEKEKAREWYDRAVEWMDKNQPKDEELRRFRAEAAELLKIEDKPAAPESK